MSNVEILTEINRYGRTNKVPIVLDDTLKLLCDTINKHGYKDILEIGTAIGYSSIAMATNCVVNHITTLELDEDRYKLATLNIEKTHLSDKIEAINIDARQYLESCNQKFDFIFLDGPKGQYIAYLPYLVNLLNVGGMIFADNVYFKGMVTGKIPTPKSVMTMVRKLQAYNDAVMHHEQLQSEILDIGDGVAISKKIK